MREVEATANARWVHVWRGVVLARGAPKPVKKQIRHSRERGNPVPFVRERLKSLDIRLRRSKAEPAFAGTTSKKCGWSEPEATILNRLQREARSLSPRWG
ncbi:hypothetical protein LG3211_1711 [Lysobacter gummosus]|nr:hypothetical protein LG3211_1711 [Lysobacter gummosus]